MGRVRVIPRAEWGAQEENGFGPRPLPFSEFWLHHSVTVAPDLLPPFTDDYAAVRTLERIGESRFGAGISYNQPVTPLGLVFEGVGVARVGAHTKGHNTAGFAFVLVGDYTRTAPTAMQEEAIARRMVELHRDGAATRHTLNGGHRDVSSTGCPGSAAYARIPAINARAAELWRGGYPTKEAPPREDLDMLTVEEVWGATVGRDERRRTMAQVLVSADANAARTAAVVDTLTAQVAGLTAAVTTLAARPDASADDVVAAVRAALSEYTLRLEHTRPPAVLEADVAAP
ncbi:MAG TPA: peptidoglycan recognition family protein [Phycicoccus sp.]